MVIICVCVCVYTLCIYTYTYVKVKVVVVQSCLTLGYPKDCSPPGSSVHGILQAGILEWLAIPFSSESSQPGIEPGIEPGSLALQANSSLSEPPGNIYTYTSRVSRRIKYKFSCS